jgi:hypothetical protein
VSPAAKAVLRLIAIVLLMGCTGNAMRPRGVAITRLAGRVSDLQGVKIRGARVELIGAPIARVSGYQGNLVVATNSSGDFKIDGLPAGEYTLVFTAAGYNTYRFPVSVQTGKTTYSNATLTPTDPR